MPSHLLLVLHLKLNVGMCSFLVSLVLYLSLFFLCMLSCISEMFPLIRNSSSLVLKFSSHLFFLLPAGSYHLRGRSIDCQDVFFDALQGWLVREAPSFRHLVPSSLLSHFRYDLLLSSLLPLSPSSSRYLPSSFVVPFRF